MEEVVVQDSDLLELPLEVQARIIQALSTDDRIRLSQTCHALAQAVVFVESTDAWVKKVLPPFEKSFYLRSLYAAIFSNNSPRIVKTLGENLVKLLRNRENFTVEQDAAIKELHLFYKGHGGKASLQLMKQKADELNKRDWRANFVQKGGEHSQGLMVGTCSWGTISWIGFGCCCPKAACCCGISIAFSVLCCGSTAAFQAFRYEKEHNVFRSRFCDVEYDLEKHPGNDFQSVLPPTVQMDAEQEEFQPILIEQDEQPSCFSRAFNFFRRPPANNPNVENIELAERFEH